MYSNLPTNFYQQYPQQQPQYYQQPPQINHLKGRPVSSLEEARAAQIDFDGSLNIFPDIANKKIYTKQINQDGTASLQVFSLIDDAGIKPPQYVTKEQFIEAIARIENSMKPKVSF